MSVHLMRSTRRRFHRPSHAHIPHAAHRAGGRPQPGEYLKWQWMSAVGRGELGRHAADSERRADAALYTVPVEDIVNCTARDRGDAMQRGVELGLVRFEPREQRIQSVMPRRLAEEAVLNKRGLV